MQLYEQIQFDWAVENYIVPLYLENNYLHVGYLSAAETAHFPDIEFITGKKVIPVLLTKKEFDANIEKVYGKRPVLNEFNHARTNGCEFQVLEKSEESTIPPEQKHEFDEGYVVSLVNKIITGAIETKASDIHVESYESILRVRYRLDGVLHEKMTPPIEKQQALISRLKIMANLDIAEKRRPQDGRIRVYRGKQVIDIRVSTLPTDFGEKIVLRILDKNHLNLDLDRLGFSKSKLELYRSLIEQPYGMILVTGPTGSGKTTTLYATLNYLNSSQVNILTIEDPIEYNLPGINQSQVKKDINYTFANALRAFLRQDPDIIMVGEIRDNETAEISIRAALTGHLVLSTLHTNNAPDTLTRLIDMGQEPFLIASSVKCIIAQRLIRTICKNCKTIASQNKYPEKISSLMGIKLSIEKFYEGKGCPLCNHTGYSGRTAIFEIMPISNRIKEAIHQRKNAHVIQKIACDEGMRTLQLSALCLLEKGVTTAAEIFRVTEAF